MTRSDFTEKELKALEILEYEIITPSAVEKSNDYCETIIVKHTDTKYSYNFSVYLNGELTLKENTSLKSFAELMTFINATDASMHITETIKG